MNDSINEWSTSNGGLAKEAWVRRLTQSAYVGNLEGTNERSGWGLLDSARSAIRNGKLELARVLLERLVARYRDSWKNPVTRAIVLNELAFVVFEQGDTARAERLYIKTHKIWIALSPLACAQDERRLHAYALFLHDYKLFLKRCHNRSRDAQSLQDRLEVVGIVFSSGSILAHIADANAMRGKFREAQLGYEQAYRRATIAQDYQLKATLTERLKLSMKRASERGVVEFEQLVETISNHDGGLKQTLLPSRHTLEDFSPEGTEILWKSYMDTAKHCAQQGRLTEAEAYFRKALNQPNLEGQKATRVANTLVEMALFYAQHPGKSLEAEDSFKRALEIAESNSDKALIAAIRAHLAKFYRDYGLAFESQRLGSQTNASITPPLSQSSSGKHMRLPQIPDQH